MLSAKDPERFVFEPSYDRKSYYGVAWNANKCVGLP